MTALTPDGERSGVVTRFIAAAIDLAAIVALLVACGIGWVATVWILDPGHVPRAPSLGLVLVAYEVIGTLYLTAGWATTGRSAGQQVMGLRVTRTRGDRVRPARATVRAATTISFPVGVLWVVVSPRRLSIQDVVLRTCVIYDWTVKPAIGAAPARRTPASPAVHEPRPPAEMN